MDDTFCRFREEMSGYGLECPELPISDGRFNRFGMSEDRRKKPCWYILTELPDGFAFGSFGCFKRDFKMSWHSKNPKNFTAEESKVYKEQLKKNVELYEAERQSWWREGARKATLIWDNSQPADDNHKYLQAKGVKSFGLHLGNRGDLIIPVRNSEDVLCGLQFIAPDGQKKFLLGTKKKGNFYRIAGNDAVIYIAEGYSTAASIHQVMGNTVIIAFDVGNLLSVSQMIRKQHLHTEIVLSADNDQFGENNVGVETATKTASIINAKIVVPQFNNLEDEPTDFNDLMLREGADTVHKQLLTLGEVVASVSCDEQQKKSQASKVIELAKDFELFHNEAKVAYATFEHDGHWETWRLDDKNFQDWLRHQFWKKHGKAISGNVLQDALAALHGKACFDGDCQEVYTRVATIDNAVYINMANERWEVVKVMCSGWEVLKKSPVKFTITTHMQALPMPERGGDFSCLWRHINVPEGYRKLVLAFILECFRTHTL